MVGHKHRTGGFLAHVKDVKTLVPDASLQHIRTGLASFLSNLE